MVVMIGGSEGREDTLTASALAAVGYPPLALGYFEEPGLPQCLCNISLGNALGGSQQADALADEQSWVRMIEFINDPWQR
jgi:hypothetical protein